MNAPVAPTALNGPVPAPPVLAWGLRGVTVRRAGVAWLDGVDLEVRPGEVTAVVGGDGAGKTTLLRVLVGALPATSGEVRRPSAHEIGFVAARTGLYADLTVDENLSFAAAAYGLDRTEAARRAGPLLARMGLADARDRLAGQLSGGMRQKLALAAAILHRPGLLVLDEPTTGVDPVSRAELWHLLAGVAAAGTAIAVATTYLDEAERATRVLLLHDGRPLGAGAPDAIVAAMPGALGGTDNGPDAVEGAIWRRGRTWRVWARDGRLPAGVERIRPDLEDAAIVAQLADEGRRPAALELPSGAVTVPPRSATAAAATPVAATLLAVERVTHRFGPLLAVDGVDLAVAPGEVVGLLGANGAGKTTLIRIALGLLRPTAGRVALFGLPPSRATRARLGYVPQGLGLWEDLTVDENIAFAERAFGGPRRPSDDPDVRAAGGTLVRDLPLGLRRRVAFAVALGHVPELLVLDEPTSGVDPVARAHLWDTIRAAAERGAGALVTTHHMAEADECDRLVIMAAGRVVVQGTAMAIVGDITAVEVAAERWEDAFAALTDAGVPVALVGRHLRTSGVDPARVRAVLAAAAVAAEVAVVPATLDEAFVALASRPAHRVHNCPVMRRDGPLGTRRAGC